MKNPFSVLGSEAAPVPRTSKGDGEARDALNTSESYVLLHGKIFCLKTHHLVEVTEAYIKVKTWILSIANVEWLACDCEKRLLPKLHTLSNDKYQKYS